MSEVRSQVPSRKRKVCIDWSDYQDMDFAGYALRAAVNVVHVYANVGPWDGGVQLDAAIKKLAGALEPLMVDEA